MASGAGQQPLREWRFAGELRRSQRVILEALPIDPADPLHIVAPPGSGKTIIGLELAMRYGYRTVVLAPTTTVRAQWAHTARSMAARHWGPDESPPPIGAVSEDPEAPTDFTALTYQMLSVLEASNPFEQLAEQAWVDELVEAGRTAADAKSWLTELSETNETAHRKGLQRRARRVRKELVRADPTQLAYALHPNARALIDRLADHGVRTIVLDECHHLLDHWAIVVHYLAAQIRARGAEPLVIGLTATLPSPEDRNEYENYTGLLGEVDFELPTPAVVKEGNLAPYRDLAWFVTPSHDELSFLRTHETALETLIGNTLATSDGLDFLEQTLLRMPEGDSQILDDEQRLAAAFKADHRIAEAAARLLSEVSPKHRIVALLGREATERATTEQRLRLLARYAHERVLPATARQPLWRQTKAVLADFGYHLTDRGIRRGRDPVDQILATSVSKDLAVGEILRHELASDEGDEIRAVVILDFAVHGHGNASRGTRAGALRCFDTIVADSQLTAMRPVLVTSQHLRIAARDGPVLIAKLAELLGTVPVVKNDTADAAVLELTVPGAGSAATVAAVSRLVTDGTVRLIVGTRGLLGEGWDCPAINTLIDLSAVATSSSTQQLRGRTLRIDPAWPAKVAHNWTVTCVIESDIKIDGNSDVTRLKRKHGRVWGITTEGPPAVVRGLRHTLTAEQTRRLHSVTEKARNASRVGKLNLLTTRTITSRAQTRERWGVGEPYTGEMNPVALSELPPGKRSLLSSLTLEAALILLLLLVGSTAVYVLDALFQSGPMHPVSASIIGVVTFGGTLWLLRGDLNAALRGIRQHALPASAYQDATLAIARVMHAQGKLPEIGRSNISVTALPLFDSVALQYQVQVNGGTSKEQAEVLDALEELFGPVHTPRFLLEVGTSTGKQGTWLTRIAAQIARIFGRETRFFAVPRDIGRRRRDAETFAEEWTRAVGSCKLHEIDSPEKLVLLTRARKASANPDARPRRHEVWA